MISIKMIGFIMAFSVNAVVNQKLSVVYSK